MRTSNYKNNNMRSTLLLALSGLALAGNAQLGPAVTSWSLNLNNQTGYNNLPSNVQQVQYSTNNVYVS